MTKMIPEDEALAMVAAAYEAAAGVVDDPGDNIANRAMGQRLCCDGRECGCHGADVGQYLQHFIRALAPDAGTAELARLRDELHLMKTAGIIEIMVRNPSVADYVQHWEGRTLKAEAERDTLAASLAAQTALVETLTGALRGLMACVHRPNPEHKYSYWHVSQGKHVEFSRFVSDAQAALSTAPQPKLRAAAQP